MEINKCKNKKCQRNLPEGYKHKYCEHCRNKHAQWAKNGLKTAGGVFILMLTKGKFGDKD